MVRAGGGTPPDIAVLKLPLAKATSEIKTIAVSDRASQRRHDGLRNWTSDAPGADVKPIFSACSRPTPRVPRRQPRRSGRE
jgi:hypothetical protein